MGAPELALAQALTVALARDNHMKYIKLIQNHCQTNWNTRCWTKIIAKPIEIQSFLQKNTPDCVAYCIGESTAKEAKKYFKDVRVAKIPTVESVIDLVNQNYI